MGKRNSSRRPKETGSIDAGEKKIRSYLWREQTTSATDKTFSERPLVDYDEEHLQRFYNLCMEMLFNSSSDKPGRIKVKSEIEAQKRCCNITLFLRYIRKQYNETEYTLYNIFSKFVSNNRDNHPDIEKRKASECIVGDCPVDFKDVTIQELMFACIDSIGSFSIKHITKRLIFAQGINLTDEDRRELTPSQDEKDKILSLENGDVFYDKSGKPRIGKFDLIKHRLGITNSEYKMYFSSAGLTYSQFKAMIQLPMFAKFSELSTEQLQTLRDKILPTLEMEVEKHIKQWKRRAREIKEVAEYKGYHLTT